MFKGVTCWKPPPPSPEIYYYFLKNEEVQKKTGWGMIPANIFLQVEIFSGAVEIFLCGVEIFSGVVQKLSEGVDNFFLDGGGE